MLVDLVQATTSDGVRLHGALELTSSFNSAVDVWLCLHGTGSNFYAGSTLAGISPRLLAAGSAVLRANTRGHDVICTGPSGSGRTWLGAAFERVSESPQDVKTWLALLRERGFNQIGLLGHSLGAVKSIFTLAGESPPEVAALVAVSPPRLSYDYFCQSPRAAEFRATLQSAEQLVRDGRGDDVMRVKIPLSYYVSAAAYLDRYGPGERYNVLNLLDRVACPTLVTFGSQEVQSEMAFRGMPEAVGELATPVNRLQAAVIAGADHLYTACHDSLAGRITAWTNRLDKTSTGH